MPAFNIVVSSTSVLFVILAIFISILFPDKPFTSDFARALFWWFLGLGVVRWIENAICSLTPNSWWGFDWFVRILSLVLLVIFLLIGVRHFFSGLNLMQGLSQ